MLALIVIAGTAWFLMAVLFLHFVRTDVNPLERGVSRYAVGRFGTVASSAFAALTIALAAAAFLTESTPLGLAAVGFLLVTILPLRSTQPIRWQYFAHQLGGAIFFAAAAVGGLAIAEDPFTQVLSWSNALALLFFLASLTPFWPRLTKVRGLLQRWCLISSSVSILSTV